MERCLDRLQDNICVPYLDDILVFTKSFNEHVEEILAVAAVLWSEIEAQEM